MWRVARTGWLRRSASAAPGASVGFHAVAVYLVRHAHAGSRSGWQGIDSERPLSERGWRQSEHLLGVLGEEPIGRIYSSPATRCVETVEPLARRFGLPIRPRPELAEGADADAVIEFLQERARRHPVLCSHGDLIPKVIRRLRAAGMHTDDQNVSAKASVWVLDLEGDRVVRGRYVPPGEAG